MRTISVCLTLRLVLMGTLGSVVQLVETKEIPHIHQNVTTARFCVRNPILKSTEAPEELKENTTMGKTPRTEAKEANSQEKCSNSVTTANDLANMDSVRMDHLEDIQQDLKTARKPASPSHSPTHLKSKHKAKNPPYAHAPPVPAGCCFSFIEFKISVHKITSAVRTSSSCPTKAVLITTDKGNEYCVKPEEPWLKKVKIM